MPERRTTLANASASAMGSTTTRESTEALGATSTLSDWVRLVRPRQWIKNGFVVAPLLFSGKAMQADAVWSSLGAFGAFCLVAAGIYCLNDVFDQVGDRVHPTKRLRPVAAGRISSAAASVAGAVLIVASLFAGWSIAPRLGLALVAYVALNLAYTTYLKHIVLVDVFAIASFFVLRLLAGVAAIDVHPSLWLLLCGGLLSLYLGFAKRRHELTLLGNGSADHRAVLQHYDEATLDQISGILLAVTVVSYIMYTLSSATALAVGSEALSYSTAFVLFGVFRYVYLVRRKDAGDPTGLLLADRTLLVDIALWIAYCGWVIYRPV